MKCPTCSREWEPPCEQVTCIERFGACMVCRYRDHKPAGLTHEQAQIELKALSRDTIHE